MATKIRIYGIQSRIHAVLGGIPDQIVLADNDTNYVLEKKTDEMLPQLSDLKEAGIHIAKYDEQHKPPFIITPELIPLGAQVTFVKDGKICNDREPSYNLILRFQMPFHKYNELASRILTAKNDARAKNQEARIKYERNVDAKINEYLYKHQKDLAELLAERGRFTNPVKVPSALDMLFEVMDAEQDKREQAKSK